jgi:sugar transferase (PEP-CTERM/EpsH1 system associated)
VRILVVLSRVPYPLEKGDKLRAYHHLKHLHQNHELIVCCLTDADVHPDAQKLLSEVSHHLYFFPLKKWKIYWNICKGVFSKKPFQVHYFYQKNIQKQLDQVIEKHVPKHIYAQLIRVTEYVNKYTHIAKTLDYMDCLSVGMHRRISHSSFFMKPMVWMESKRLQNYENEVFDHYEHKIIISSQDRLQIKHPRRDQIHVIPNGIDADFFNMRHFQTTQKKYDLLFTGNMSYLPNIEAVTFLVKKIMPLLRKQKPDISLLICGATPSKLVRSYASKNIDVSGWVEDIREAYAQSRVFVAPLFLGSGLQNKLLEAMRMDIPCVTTSLANGGLHAKPDQEVMIANTADQFTEKTLHLLKNQEDSLRISKNAFQFVEENFSWEKTVLSLDKLICQQSL